MKLSLQVMTYPVDWLIVVPTEFFDKWRGRVVDSDLNFNVALKLLNLCKTLSISILVKQHWTLKRTDTGALLYHLHDMCDP